MELELQRSRFITTVALAPTVEEAKAFIARVREEFSDATHNCWAHVVGPPGSSAQVGMSDDGEPHGTAAARCSPCCSTRAWATSPLSSPGITAGLCW